MLFATVLVLLASSIVFTTRGASATPGDSRAEKLSHEYAAVTKAARTESLAFLTVDYKNMDRHIAKVLAGATGTLKKQYEGVKVTLKARAQRDRVMTTPTIVEVGVGDIGDDAAIAFVAANASVVRKLNKGRPEVAYHRLKLTMVRRDDKWLTSNIQIVM